MYVVMARQDKKEEAWEQAFEKWQAGIPENERIAQVIPADGGTGK
jgi:hypothetical protein